MPCQAPADPTGLWDLPRYAPTPNTWQHEFLWVQSCLLRKRTVRISSGHFQPLILYMETSHPGVSSIMSTTSGRRRKEEAGSLLAALTSHSLCVSQAPLPWTGPCHQMAAQTSAESCRLTALTRNSWKRTLHSLLCVNTGGSVHPPAAAGTKEFPLPKITTSRPSLHPPCSLHPSASRDIIPVCHCPC